MLLLSIAYPQSFSPHFLFNGTPSAFLTRSANLTPEETTNIKEISLTIYGNKVQSFSNACLCCTITVGACFIFPLCFMCCHWWKSLAYPKYLIDYSVYEGVANMLSQSSATHLKLTIYDNGLDVRKIEILSGILEQRPLKSCIIENNAMELDYKSNEYSDFEENAKKLINICQSAGTIHQIKWGTKTFWFIFSSN